MTRKIEKKWRGVAPAENPRSRARSKRCPINACRNRLLRARLLKGDARGDETMRKNRLIVVLGALLGLAFFITMMYLLQTTRPRIDAEAFAKLEAGMTPEEVRAILGRPHNASD